MGGFALHDADKTFLRVLDESTLEELDMAGEIEWPTATAKEIQDRSKADIFSKGIVLLQTAWFIVQCISRFATKLAVTELEVVTLAFAALNAVTYWLWWDEPLDVRCAVPVYLKSTEVSANARVSEARRQHIYVPTSPMQSATKAKGFLALFKCAFEHRRNKHGLVLAILYTLFWVPIKVTFGSLWAMLGEAGIPNDDVTRVPTLYSPREAPGVTPSDWTMLGVIALFGAIHFIPWSSTFPTATEKWLWRGSTILITGGPLLTLFPVIISSWFSNPSLESITRPSFIFMLLILIPVYIVSRIILLILPLILLRNLPPAALLELKWSEFFPHI